MKLKIITVAASLLALAACDDDADVDENEYLSFARAALEDIKREARNEALREASGRIYDMIAGDEPDDPTGAHFRDQILAMRKGENE